VVRRCDWAVGGIQSRTLVARGGLAGRRPVPTKNTLGYHTHGEVIAISTWHKIVLSSKPDWHAEQTKIEKALKYSSTPERTVLRNGFVLRPDRS